MSNYRSFTNILQNDNTALTFGTDNGGESVGNSCGSLPAIGGSTETVRGFQNDLDNGTEVV
jgi:hypothetical protein